MFAHVDARGATVSVRRGHHAAFQEQSRSRAPLLTVRHEDAEVAAQGRKDAEDHEGAVDGPRRCLS